ncbi:MAG: tRNA 2-thiouridine(34) synthase MnmA [Xanthomonadales bacterium]|nr:tRNA 2-thiouridine(34) synthase MnmA [Gammaproteobacteria bacterium]MBT8052741.1 tRNA 2-thiouridine(34) synthase MnmA [Gammaproteobacteria bacterium]NND55903.1 tRNA 2-thiouridine(34) synthase MnmA [Xanthomonadales bacterium]NNK50601.1 tRNA 2-thiouridine(34) synthase MnmA [Xanthomonadales bacterium]
MKEAPKNREVVMVAMSGGVDSSVAALLLQQEGRPIAGMFMKNWEEDDRFGTCPAEQDAADAQAVADAIGIDLHRRNFAAEYWDHVFEEFLAEYRAGRTPNPDILCNREIKFKTFMEHAADLGAEFIATGHYVRSDCVDGVHRLLRGRDPNKDQSYFLYTIGQEQLAQTLFPVGELLKPEVRRLAEQASLPVHDKKDSTGICFIGERNFKDFLSEYIPPCPGEIRTTGESVIGEHPGLMYFTLGQRQGLGIGGLRGFSDDPWYVLHKDQERNVMYAGQGHDHPWLFARVLHAEQLSWVSGKPPQAGAGLTAKVRYRQEDQACSVSEISADRLVLTFEQPQRAVTAGQSVVLYDGDSCLGGGVINWANTFPATRKWPKEKW